MRRVLLCGAFGQGNPGDDALLESFLDGLAGHDVRVTTTGAVPAPARPVAPDRRSVAQALREVDAVVVGGGTVFKSLHPSVPRRASSLVARTALLRAATAARGLPLALVGVGAGTLRGRTVRRLAAWTADRADLLVLRDEESAAVLAEAGATGPFRVGADATWRVLDVATSQPARRPGPDAPVLVVLSHHADHHATRLTDGVTAVVEHLLERGHAVTLQPWADGDGGDLRLGADVLRRVRSGGIALADPPATLHDVRRAAAEHGAVVTLRFHGLVAAAAAGRPALAFAHEPKLAGLARRLAQPTVPSHASPAVMAHAVDALLDTPSPAPASLRHEVEAARHTNALLRLVVSGGVEDDAVDRAPLDLSSGVPW